MLLRILKQFCVLEPRVLLQSSTHNRSGIKVCPDNLDKPCLSFISMNSTTMLKSEKRPFTTLSNVVLTQSNVYPNKGGRCMEYYCPLINQRRFYAKKGKKQKGGHKILHKVDLSNEELASVIDAEKFQSQMKSILDYMQAEFIGKIQLRSNASVFDQLQVETEDGNFPLIQIAQITQKNPTLVMVNMATMPQYIGAVKEAITKSKLNINPQQDGTTLFLPIPKVSREHREELAKAAKVIFDHSKEKFRDVQNKYAKESKLQGKDGKVPKELAQNVEEYVRNTYQEYITKAEDMLKMKQSELLGK